MMMQDSNPSSTVTTNATATAAAAVNNQPTLATVCGQCGIEERKLLHNIRLRGNFRRLCTTCVLRLHPQCFCPACLGVYERSPPDDVIVCYKCYSSSHSSCVSSPPAAAAAAIASSRGPSPCSSCLNPNALVLNLNRLENGSRNGGRAIDKNSARLLLAAGKIASMSMNKAEVAAAMEAERRSKEAAYTKKRAREALDHVVKLMAIEKRNVIESNKKAFNANNNNNNSVVAMPMPIGMVDANAVNKNNKLDASNEVLEALNAVELKETGTQGDNGVVVMEVDIVNGKDSGVNLIAENGSVKTDDLVKIVQEQPQPLEKIHPLVENGVSNPKH